MTSCILVCRFQSFGWDCCLHLQSGSTYLILQNTGSAALAYIWITSVQLFPMLSSKGASWIITIDNCWSFLFHCQTNTDFNVCQATSRAINYKKRSNIVLRFSKKAESTNVCPWRVCHILQVFPVIWFISRTTQHIRHMYLLLWNLQMQEGISYVLIWITFLCWRFYISNHNFTLE
jgi:hypothetical protein